MTLGLLDGTMVIPVPLSIGFMVTPQNTVPTIAPPRPNISITRVSGCTDVNNVTTLCTKPAFVYIFGSGFPSTAALLVSFGNERCTIAGWLSTRITCRIDATWSATPLNTLLPVIVTNFLTNNRSNVYYGVSFTSAPFSRSLPSPAVRGRARRRSTAM